VSRGLDALTAALIRAEVAIWPGDWQRLEAELGAAKDAGLPRASFEEMLLQGVLFFGFPRIVTAFEVLQKRWPSAPAPGGGGLPAERQAAAGRELFAAIYGKNDAPVRALLRSFHSEFHDFVLEAAYGRVLTRPGLAAKERELLAAAALAAMAQTPQLVAHARGALRFGATEDEVRGAIALGAAAPDEVEGLLRRVLG
jgi:alkylhydroperoxidase/carboxymuconolactone decarboxylase family protein YurZ